MKEVLPSERIWTTRTSKVNWRIFSSLFLSIVTRLHIMLSSWNHKLHQRDVKKQVTTTDMLCAFIEPSCGASCLVITARNLPRQGSCTSLDSMPTFWCFPAFVAQATGHCTNSQPAFESLCLCCVTERSIDHIQHIGVLPVFLVENLFSSVRFSWRRTRSLACLETVSEWVCKDWRTATKFALHRRVFPIPPLSEVKGFTGHKWQLSNSNNSSSEIENQTDCWETNLENFSNIPACRLLQHQDQAVQDFCLNWVRQERAVSKRIKSFFSSNVSLCQCEEGAGNPSSSLLNVRVNISKVEMKATPFMWCFRQGSCTQMICVVYLNDGNVMYGILCQQEESLQFLIDVHARWLKQVEEHFEVVCSFWKTAVLHQTKLISRVGCLLQTASVLLSEDIGCVVQICFWVW